MNTTGTFAAGWLRAEIDAAVKDVAQKSYLTQGMKESIVQATRVIESSERLRKPSGSMDVQLKVHGSK